MTQGFRLAIMDAVPRIHWDDDEGITDGEKFRDLLQPLSPDTAIDIFYASAGEFPTRVQAYDGYLISGSPASVHDEFDWILRLADLIVDADSRQKRIVASCFGHQLVAKAFGGEVDKNEDGWMIGNFQLDIQQQFDWMQPAAPSTGLFHFNKERVTCLPAGAVGFARSDDYEDFAYTLGDNILCVQGHPEQPLRAMHNFLEVVAAELTPQELQRASDRIGRGVPDAAIWGQWMMRFLLA